MSHKKIWAVNLKDKKSVTEAIKEMSYALMSTLECQQELLDQVSPQLTEDIMSQQAWLVDYMVYAILELRLAHVYAADGMREEAQQQADKFKATANILADEILLLEQAQKKRNAHKRRILDTI